MKITPQGIAVLDDDKDRLLSRWVEENKRLDHSGYIQEHFCKYIKPGDVVIDAGAAIGDHTIAYIETCGNPNNVHAFEPNPLMFECLRYNCPKVNLYPLGLSDEIDFGCINHMNENAGGSFVDLACGDKNNSAVIIPLVPLDHYEFSKVDFIKMDIEGFECRAIKGASETLKRCRPKMVIEVNKWMLERAGNSAKELFDTLLSLGYRWNIEMGSEPDGTPDSRGEYFCYPI